MMAPSGAGPHHQMIHPSQNQMAMMDRVGPGGAVLHPGAADISKRKSRKPTDKTMPDGVEDVTIGDGVLRYRELRDYERRLDATMTRKRLDVVDSNHRDNKRYKTLRIWISNTVEHQPWQVEPRAAEGTDFATSQASSYRVKIEGRLLDDGDDDDDAAEKEKEDTDGDRMDMDGPARIKGTTSSAASQAQRPRFSHFFKAITVEVNQSITAGGKPETIVDWKKPGVPQQHQQQQPLPPPGSGAGTSAAADFDELTFRRSGDQNLNVTINLTRHEDPERFVLNPALAEVVDATEATRQEIVVRVWDYIKLMGLQEDEEKRNFRCDELLRNVVGKEQGSIPGLQEYISQHIRPLPPISLPYTIRTDAEFFQANDKGDPEPTIYDVAVCVDDPLKRHLSRFVYNRSYAEMLKRVSELDDQLALLVQAVGESKVKHTFLTSFRDDPANFVRNWLSSQQRDLEVIMGEAVRGGGEDAPGDVWRKGGRDSIWNSEGARESVNVMLAKQHPRI